jgi:hypothetical protein
MTARSRARDKNEPIELINQALEKVENLGVGSGRLVRFHRCFARELAHLRCEVDDNGESVIL